MSEYNRTHIAGKNLRNSTSCFFFPGGGIFSTKVSLKLQRDVDEFSLPTPPTRCQQSIELCLMTNVKGGSIDTGDSHHSHEWTMLSPGEGLAFHRSSEVILILRLERYLRYM